MQYKNIIIGVLREIMTGENRVSVVPETAAQFISKGARVVVETGAGKGVFFDDEDYEAVGAEIVSGPEEVCSKANVFLKVKEPLFNSNLEKHEAEMLPPNSILVSFLHPANDLNHKMVEKLAQRDITSFTLDSVPRISRAQRMDALTSMSTVAGYKAVTFAADHLARFIPMMPTAFGMIKPAQFLVIGTGVVGLQSIATAKRLGAKVLTLDIRPEANEQAKSLGAEVIPFEVPPELAVGKGGYARRLPEEWYQKERETLLPYLEKSDVVILTALIPGEVAPLLIDVSMIEKMKKGSLILDISVDQGGNCQLSKSGVNQYHNNVLISSIANIPATLPVDSSWMFSQNIMYFLHYIFKDGEIDTESDDEIIREMLVTKQGKIVHRGTLEAIKNLNS